jgi:hypothetical protein
MTNAETKKRKANMSHDDRGLRTTVEKLEATEVAIEHDIHDIDETLGKPTAAQKQVIEDLTRLQFSLRGPEIQLDKHSYSRPIPPKQVRYSKETGVVISSASQL